MNKEKKKLDIRRRTLAVVMGELSEQHPEMRDELNDLMSAL